MAGDALPEGLYEDLVTLGIRDRVAELGPRASVRRVDDPEQPGLLARHVAAVVERILEDLQPPERILTANAILTAAAGATDAASVVDAHLAAAGDGSPELLLEVLSGRAGDMPRRRPELPLRRTDLLVNDRGEPRLAHEIAAEIESADRVDLLCAFVKFSGLRLIVDELEAAVRRGVPVRVITTTYMGATDPQALERLHALGAEIRISYETRRTRLHAKAWLFTRASGLDTAYVGSSNLSTAALTDGLEWNVRLSRFENANVLTKFGATFEAYWLDPSFEPFDPVADGARLREALQQSGTGGFALSGLEVHPYPFQQEILDRLDAERHVHDRWRNLVVAATGTGKTVIAALDFRRLRAELGGDPTLLFVAHRSEILQQSLRTFREVLGDPAFGELSVGGERPGAWRHVFASIQGMGPVLDGRFGAIAPDHFDVVIVDEFHHAAAPTYDRLLSLVRPRVLLGLTATPERSDGRSITRWFDGHTAAELRLWEALEQDLLAPFHYFGAHDGTDLRSLEWLRGGYDVEGLSRILTGDDARSRVVLRELRRRVTDPSRMRALAFCVSKEHAAYMARVFREAGLAAEHLVAESDAEHRRRTLERLAAGEVQVVCSVDLFNEGLDVPEVDTVLLLRPTESATIFLQQLGRGLRHAPGKACLTVLDFIGMQHRQFRFDLRLRAMTGLPRTQVPAAVEAGFPFLPSGCHVELDAVATRTVLENLRSQVAPRRDALVAEVRSARTTDLARWLDESGRSLGDVYGRGQRSWTQLLRLAELAPPPAVDDERLLVRLAKLVAVDDPERAQTWRRWFSETTPPDFSALSRRDQRLATMLLFSFTNDGFGLSAEQEVLDRIWSSADVRREAIQVLDLAERRIERVSIPLPPHFDDCPLLVHASYSREELLAGIGYASMRRKPRSDMTGVRYVPELRADVFTSTINKTPGRYAPNTMYRDYPVSVDRFHWESQNRTSVESDVGQRYLHHAERGGWILLFARIQEQDDLGTAPFLFLGPATIESHTGTRPIGIVWRLHHPLPPAFLAASGVLAG
jgi:superfamily II DNA or RNA helicase/HKD family nuclease